VVPMKWAAKLAFIVLTLYGASYAPFSLAGSYDRGPRDYIGDVYWCPAGMTCRQVAEPQVSLNVLGDLYYPLLAVDRALVHPSYHRC
jgi:hypothetical protein